MLDILKVVSAINTPENAFMILGAKELVPEGFEYRCFVELYTVIRLRIRTKAIALRMVEDY